MSSSSSTNTAHQPFPIDWVRNSFPALNTGDNFVFFDNGAGAQVPQGVLDAVHNHMLMRQVQRGGRYSRSREVDASIQRARESVATFLNAAEPEEIAFGMNATSFIRIVSLAIAETLQDRKEMIVSDMDHEANIATWIALERNGVHIRWWNMRQDGNLYLDDLRPLLNERTRLVACTLASNALGSIVDIAQVSHLAHAAGAEVFVDAVHYAPHGPIDVRQLDCDYLVCSGYKIFGPHMGFLWGKRKALEALPTFREDFIPDAIPIKIEVGTFNYENVAGMDAAISYLEDLGNRVSDNGRAGSRRGRLVSAMEKIREYEATLSARLLAGLARLNNVVIYGIKNSTGMRVPTICFTVQGVSPVQVTTELAEAGIGVRDGNMYSPRLLKRLSISPEAGAVRVSLAHYNSFEEIDRLLQALADIAGND